MIREKSYIKTGKQTSGTVLLIQALKKLGVTFYSGVTGGGVVPLTKLLFPLGDLLQSKRNIPRFLTMPEYVAGFIPLGYYLASGKIAGAIATTGAATKLISSGITDAKLHNIPAVYLVALNQTTSLGLAPLQDTSVDGMNIIPQLKAELKDGCIVINDIRKLEKQIGKVQKILSESKPVVITFHPDILLKNTEMAIIKTQEPPKINEKDLKKFLDEFPPIIKEKRVIIYAGEEAARYKNIQHLTTRLSNLLRAPTIWSINGANAISSKNKYGYGYTLFGGNDKAIELWKSINKNDVIIMLGFDPGEYSLNLEKIRAGFVWHFTNLKKPYGSKDGGFRHRTAGGYQQIRGDIKLLLQRIVSKLETQEIIKDKPKIKSPTNLNVKKISRKVKKNCIDLISFYEEIQKYWQPHSIGFDDACIASKDRQHITQRPHPNIRFYSLYNGYAMGSAFGLGIGAKIANPHLHTFIFSGDGCWRLFGSALADAANLGLKLFILNNGTYGIVEQGIKIMLPNLEKNHYHTKLPAIDFILAAKAHGWDSIKLKSDLSNLKEIMNKCYSSNKKSILIEMRSDPDQFIGLNFRHENLRPIKHTSIKRT